MTNSEFVPDDSFPRCTANNVFFFIKGNQILSGLSIEEYKTTLKIIKQAILATDLALYIK
jgi:hypothetical protein